MKLQFDPRNGLCAQVGGDLWHPGKGEQANEAKRICLQCPVIESCLEYALEHTELEGIWGGLSYWGRQKLRTERRRAVH